MPDVAGRPGHPGRTGGARVALRARGDHADVGPAGVRAARVRSAPPPVVARVALLCPDLLFGSKAEGVLRAAGHEVERFSDVAAARSADADVLVVDLTSDVDERLGLGGVSGP